MWKFHCETPPPNDPDASPRIVAVAVLVVAVSQRTCRQNAWHPSLVDDCNLTSMGHIAITYDKNVPCMSWYQIVLVGHQILVPAMRYSVPPFVPHPTRSRHPR